jgi:hypothetical protein
VACAPGPCGTVFRRKASRRSLGGGLSNERRRGDERLCERPARRATREVAPQQQPLDLRELTIQAKRCPLSCAAAAAVAIQPCASHPYFCDDSEGGRLGVQRKNLRGTILSRPAHAVAARRSFLLSPAATLATWSRCQTWLAMKLGCMTIWLQDRYGAPPYSAPGRSCVTRRGPVGHHPARGGTSRRRSARDPPV